MIAITDLFRELLSFCDEDALANLEQLNRASRSFTRDPSLWQTLWGGPLPTRAVLPANTFRGAVLWKRSLLRSRISADFKAETPIDGFPKHIRMFRITDMYIIAATANAICVWSRANDTMLAELPLPGFVGISCLEAHAQTLAIGTSVGILLVVSLPNLEVVARIGVLHGTVTCAKFRADNRLLVGGDDGVVRLFGLPDCSKLQEIQANTSAVSCLSCNRDVWVSGSRDGCVRIWSSQTNQLRQELVLPAVNGRRMPVHCVSYSADNDLYIACGHRVLVWRTSRANRETELVCTHPRAVKQLVLVGKLLFTSAGDWRVRVWDRYTHDCLRCIDNPTGAPITCIAVADGKLFLSSLFNQALTELACTY